jgi:rRNA pseudouridine-1189 N-methylase Emg1 (Nep1/Mra1 family)
MGLPELKQKIQMQIENADERLLRIVSSVFDNYLNEDTNTENMASEPTVAFDITGKPLTLKQYNKEIDKGIDDFNNGRFISQEDLEKEIDSWYDE